MGNVLFEDEYYETQEESQIILSASIENESLSKALYKTKKKYGYVNFSYMTVLTGKTAAELIQELGGKSIWQDPEIYMMNEEEEDGWMFPEQYFTGNLYRKLALAKEMNKNGRFTKNIEELKRRLPEKVEKEEIRFSLGSMGVTADVYNIFAKEIFELYEYPDFEFIEQTRKWHADKSIGKHSIKNNYTYGNEYMTGLEVMEHTMNAIPCVARDPGKKDGEYIVNQEKTLELQDKQRLLQETFRIWLSHHVRILEQLQEFYCKRFGYGSSEYDASFLDFADLNQEITLYKHQKEAVARILFSDNVLLAHRVGDGKTMSYVVAAHEIQKLDDKKQKILILVPNNVLDATVKTHEKLYPNDNILAVYPDDFNKTNRKKTVQKIKENNYVAIYMAQSSDEMMVMSKQYYLQKKADEMRKCKAALAAAPKKSFEERTLKSMLKKLEKEHWKLIREVGPSKEKCFDDLGITVLMVDECHNYKNITLNMRYGNVVGSHTKGSKKCDSMLEKVHYIQEQGGKVVFGSGTPLTNSMTDLYVLQKYLQPKELEFCQISGFGQWLNTFAQQETAFEMDVDSQNFRLMTRFTKFHNLPELMGMFSTVCDFHYPDNEELGLPEFEGYTDVMVLKSDAQSEYIQKIVERTEDIRAKNVGRNEDNLLKITMDGRKCALDVRLVSENPEIPVMDCKTTVCADQIVSVYHEFPGMTQSVFCDISTPKKEFNIYDELKQQLILRGIPKHEIAFIHDATTETKRRKMLEDMNAGRIRVMVGSTQKLGTGVNAQERMIAIHHLDIPWRPADIVQREGRLIRQGNINKKVRIYRYVTEGSFDAYTWQIMENKQKFIASFLAGTLDKSHREEDDISDTVLNYAEIKALAIGNPLIKKRVETANTIEHLRISMRQRRKQMVELQEIMLDLPKEIAEREKLITTVDSDYHYYIENKQEYESELTSDELKQERKEFDTELLEALKGNGMQPKDRVFDWYLGFDVVLPAYMSWERPHIMLKREGGGSYMIKMDGEKGIRCSQRLENVLSGLLKRKQEHEEHYMVLIQKLKDAREDLQKGNPYEKELLEKVELLNEIDRELNEG